MATNMQMQRHLGPGLNMSRQRQIQLRWPMKIKRHTFPVEVPDAKVVHILPLNRHTVEDVSGNLLDVYLERYFYCSYVHICHPAKKEVKPYSYRPVKKGDVFLVRNADNHPVEFKVAETDPAP
eukprot:scaffold97578_cov25-Cyclotella_meneghiniana.AAC.2